MDTPVTESAASAARNMEKDVADLIQIIGQSLNAVLLYGHGHKVARQSLELSFAVMSKFIEYYGPINLSVTEGVILVNGTSAAECPQAAGLASRLTGLNLMSLVIDSGFLWDEYVKFFSLLLTPQAKAGATLNGAELVASQGFNHLQAQAFSYRRVAEGEESSNPSPAPANESAAPTPDYVPNNDNLAAFLKGDTTVDPERAAQDLRRLAEDPAKLAELVLKNAGQQSDAGLLPKDQSLADLLAEYIRKVLEQIVSDPSLKTQKGRKQAKRSLTDLETILQESLPKLIGEKDAKQVKGLINDAIGDLDLDTLAGKYIKSRLAANESGNKLARLIQRVGGDPAQLDEVREHLVHEGLTEDEWRDLIRRRDERTTGSGSRSGKQEEAGEIKALALLLASLNETLLQAPPTPSTPQAVQSLIAEAEQELSSLTRKTGQKIRALQDELHGDDATKPLSRKALLERLAELAQEISQPLTIISGTTAIIRSLRTGPLTDTQGELLGMVAESTERMIVLVDALMRMAGPPITLQPDRDILDDAYGK